MTRPMYDGITPAAVPAGAAIYAGYDDGTWQSYAALAEAHPAALHVSICVTATGTARVLDVETGDATPAQAPGWAEAQRAVGNPYPVVYMNMTTWPAVKAAFAEQAVDAPLYWVALYVTDPADVPDIPDGAIAIQYYDYGGYDASAAADYWPGLDPAPAPHPAAAAALEEEDDDMSITSKDGRAGLSWAAGTRHVVQVNYAAAAQPDLVLAVELKLTTGPLYVPRWTVDHTLGTGTLEIPAEHIAACRGVILTGPAATVFDASAV